MEHQRRSRRLAAAASGIVVFALWGCDSGGPTAPPPDPGPPTVWHEPNELGLSPGDKRTHSLPLNNPSFVPREEARHMRDDDLVVGVLVGERPRAYPWWILRNHHVVNDTVTVPDPPEGGAVDGDPQWTKHVHRRPEQGRHASHVPLLITLCEACSGAAVFVPVVDAYPEHALVFAQCRSEGSPAGDFEAIGVYTLCDMQTHSRWHPFTGQAESGPLTGVQLSRLPVFIEHWSEWAERYPDTLVVIAGEEMRERVHSGWDVGMGRPGAHSSYIRWAQENPDQVDSRLPPHALVVGLSTPEGDSLAFPFARLKKEGGFVQLEFAGEPFLLTLNTSYGVTVFHGRVDRQALDFELRSTNPLRFADTEGSTWNELGSAVSGPREGRSLAVVDDSYLAEWSDWIMAHPGGEIAP